MPQNDTQYVGVHAHAQPARRPVQQVRQPQPQVIKIPWWNRPISWGIGLAAFAFLLLVSVASIGNADNTVKTVETHPISHVQEYRPSLSPQATEEPTTATADNNSVAAGRDISADNGSTVTINNGPVTHNHYHTSPPIVEKVVERVTVIEQPKIIYVERPIETVTVIERPAKRVVITQVNAECDERLEQHLKQVAAWEAQFKK